MLFLGISYCNLKIFCQEYRYLRKQINNSDYHVFSKGKALTKEYIHLAHKSFHTIVVVYFLIRLMLVCTIKPHGCTIWIGKVNLT